MTNGVLADAYGRRMSCAAPATPVVAVGVDAREVAGGEEAGPTVAEEEEEEEEKKNAGARAEAVCCCEA